MLKKNKKSTKKRAQGIIKNPVILLGALAVIAGFVYWTSHHNPNHVPTNPNGSTASTKSSGSGSPTKSQPVTNSVNQGGATDKNGSAPAPSTTSSQWATSSSGIITLKQPVKDSAFTSGSYISGTAKVSQVQYRLVDNSVGVIAQGNLNAVSGKFSGVLYFQKHGSGGQLDVFSYSSTGKEINEIQINLSF